MFNTVRQELVNLVRTACKSFARFIGLLITLNYNIYINGMQGLPCFLLPLIRLVVTFIEHYDLLSDLCTKSFSIFTCIVYITVFRVGYMGDTDSSKAIFCMNNGFLSLLSLISLRWSGTFQ